MPPPEPQDCLMVETGEPQRRTIVPDSNPITATEISEWRSALSSLECMGETLEIDFHANKLNLKRLMGFTVVPGHISKHYSVTGLTLRYHHVSNEASDTQGETDHP